MNIFNNWDATTSLTLISIILAIIGGVFAYIQWRSSEKFKRMEILDEIINKLRSDSEIAKTLYLFDYGVNWYTEDFHNNRGSDLEYKIDKVLSYVNFICYLNREKCIKIKEFKMVEYTISRICYSPSTKKYLWNLYHFSKTMKRKSSFSYIIDYGIENGFIEKEFKNNDKDFNGYCKILNF